MKKIISSLVAGATVTSLLIGMGSIALAVNPRPNRNDVVVEAPGNYTYNASWTTDVTQDGGKKSGSIKLGDHSDDASDFAYYGFTGWWDQNLSDITKIRASFMPAIGTVNSGGSPRISLEVDLDGDADFDTNDAVIYLDPAHCSNPAPTGGGWVEANFTGDLTDCSIFDSMGNQYTSDGITSAWDMIVADPIYADAKVWFAYLIQDATVGTNYVDRIMLDSALFTKQP